MLGIRSAIALFVVLLASAWPAWAYTALDIQRMIIEEATARRVPAALALAVARVESNFNPRAESPVGAKGVMQIMPKTARDVFGVAEHQLWDARLNIRLGIDYLIQLYNQYGQRWDLALSHYNGGTLKGGSGRFAIPHDYTRQYVADVLRWQRTYATNVLDPSVRARTGDPQFLPLTNAPARPWRISTGAKAPTAPPPRGGRIDPFEFSAWADAQQRRIADRRDSAPRVARD